MRKEIIKSIKDEIELRRKLGAASDTIHVEDAIDIRAVARKVEEFRDKAQALKEKRLEKAKRETDEIVRSIDVTKIHEAKSN
jgi:hypothetical protein